MGPATTRLALIPQTARQFRSGKRWRRCFPTLEVSISGCEPINDFAFEGEIRNGKLALREVPLIWTQTDPKTGEKFSGTRDQIEAWEKAREEHPPGSDTAPAVNDDLPF
jgi:hypothetical protein